MLNLVSILDKNCFIYLFVEWNIIVRFLVIYKIIFSVENNICQSICLLFDIDIFFGFYFWEYPSGSEIIFNLIYILKSILFIS